MSSNMKDSGIEWIGDIPGDWNITKVKYVFSDTNAGEVIDKNYWNCGDELLYTCQKTPMQSNFINFPAWKRTGEKDLLLTRNATPYIFIPQKGSIYSNVVQRIVVKDGYDLRYLSYSILLGAEALTVNGDTIPSYNMEVWKNIFIPMMDLKLQRIISDYLDEKCKKIDNLISKTQASIEEYKKLKQSIITRAVTKGVRGDREMKDSNTEWIGKIPVEWDVYRISTLYEERKEQGHEELPILTVSINSGVSDRELSDEEKERVFVRSEDKSKYMRVYPGDLTYNMMRAWQGAFGAVRVCGMVSPAYVIVKPKCEIDSRYMEALLRTQYAKEEMKRFSYGIADFRLRLYWDKFRNIKVCLPPIYEQREISDYIDMKCVEINNLVIKKQQLIIELEKYKKTMIYEYVTGKKTVA